MQEERRERGPGIELRIPGGSITESKMPSFYHSAPFQYLDAAGRRN
jgi:hypothetical protein